MTTINDVMPSWLAGSDIGDRLAKEAAKARLNNPGLALLAFTYGLRAHHNDAGFWDGLFAGFAPAEIAGIDRILSEERARATDEATALASIVSAEVK